MLKGDDFMKSTHVPRKSTLSPVNSEKGNTHATWPTAKKGGSTTAKIKPSLTKK